MRFSVDTAAVNWTYDASRMQGLRICPAKIDYTSGMTLHLVTFTYCISILFHQKLALHKSLHPWTLQAGCTVLG